MTDHNREEREALIEEAATMLRHYGYGHLADGIEAVFEQAHTPTSGERVPGFSEREKRAARAWEFFTRDDREMSHDFRGGYHQGMIDGFRRTVQGEPSGHRAILIQQARAHADDYRRYDDTEDLVGTLVEMANMLAADAPVQGDPSDTDNADQVEAGAEVLYELYTANIVADWDDISERERQEYRSAARAALRAAAAVREEGRGHG